MNHSLYLTAAYVFTALCMVIEVIALRRRRAAALRRQDERAEERE